MDIRKIQVTGGSSYVLSLPKSWAVSHHIQKNDPIGIITQADGNLLITADIKGTSSQREKDFFLKDYPNPECLFRCLIGAYITGFTTIKITSKVRIPPEVRQRVRLYTQMTIGQEVAEETDHLIVIKDILNPAEMPLDNTIKRMYSIVKAMHEDAITALEEGRSDLCLDIISRDNDIDRLHWLINRQYHLIIHNPALSRRMDITVGAAMTFFQISRTIERIADHAVTIASNVQNLLDSNLEPALILRIREADEVALGIFRRSMRSFYDKNIPEANANIASVDELTLLYKGLKQESTKLKNPDSIYCGYIANSIARIGEYSSDISEIVINHCISEE
ncbi:MAG: PhoU domain-containing protein [Methanocalculus sp.]|uniref:phosphate uptake regulator PhoU n=1 Tax=Methanocalculus sp. TaxID=2004547 RepID=UPI0027282B11|nr:phosphate uptake regulator PhoU [Methanocalculus sp.]MDO9540664.1 PhoU domain-containing protein [Methanocalculus sp.]